METKDFAAIIDLAIAKEEEAYDFYIELMKIVEAKESQGYTPIYCRRGKETQGVPRQLPGERPWG